MALLFKISFTYIHLHLIRVDILVNNFIQGSTASIPISAIRDVMLTLYVPVLNGKGADKTRDIKY